MLTLIKNGLVYSPDFIGKKDILITSDKIGYILDTIETPAVPATIIDAEGKLVFPGFIDSHIHIIGAGGEEGFHTRTPELRMTDATTAGITTVVGVIGTDGTTRTMEALLAKAYSLENEGISAFIHTGSYQVPVKTLSGKIENDIMLIDKIIGVGEVAIADARSSQPTSRELARIASLAMISGKACGVKGVVNVHVGEGPDRLSLLEEVVSTTNVSITQFHCTHINRTRNLFEAGIEYAKRGGFVDFTTCTDPKSMQKEVKCSKALKEMLEHGVPIEQITFTSDGQISLPVFDDNLKQVGFKVGKPATLYREVKDAILEEQLPIETAIRVITSNPAEILGLNAKGSIKEGKDADVVIVDKETMVIDTVLARGKVMVQGGEAVVKDVFEW
ncbi:beta-aspartyl-peptidase [Peribacillus saganii]|uniref:Isoaspartyl dipeptidase n=1 Tax=Peribacillus saganii TaxID=2303992 RepID=A0A372LQQ7_9BACI|nr:beta-aspartyl-peptidase [Peribacillus saganii]RFU70061.1 beta-aspartyl-peptidase [Peribacillus saganii]